MTVVLVQLVVGCMNMVVGLLAMTFSLNASPGGPSSVPAGFVQVSIMAFIFGILSFATACLAAAPVLGRRAVVPQPLPASQPYEYYPQRPMPPSQAYRYYQTPPVGQPYEYYSQQPTASQPPQYYPPQVRVRQYVTQRQQTLVQREWAGLACPECGRNVSEGDSFCDHCGAQFREISEPGLGVEREGIGIT